MTIKYWSPADSKFIKESCVEILFRNSTAFIIYEDESVKEITPQFIVCITA